MPYLSVNDVSLFYEEAGAGPPLVLISGLGASRVAYATVVPALADRYRVITFDNRGTGRSDVPPGPYTIEQLAGDAAGLIRALDLAPALVVGWSMGGVILQSMLIDHSDTVAAAVLLSTLGSYTEMQHPWLDGLLALRRAGVDPVVLGALGLPWVFTPALLSDHTRVRAMLDLGAADPEPTSDEGFAAQAQAIREFDRRDELGGVVTPTLVLVGAEDVLTPPSQSIDIARRIPGAELVILPRGGHAMLVELPAPTPWAIEGFLGAGLETRA